MEHPMQLLDPQGPRNLFASRLDTLEHLLRKARTHFEGDESFLGHRLAPDMLALRTQVVFACNQPRHFVLWCKGRDLLGRGTS